MNNLTISFMLRMILTFQDYRLMYIYSANLNDDFSSVPAQLASEHMVPLTLMNFDKTQISIRSKCEGPILNVIVMNDLSDTTSMLKIKKYLLPNDLTFIWLTSNETAVQFQPNWIKLSIKVLISSKTFLMSLNHFCVDPINKIAIQPLDRIKIQRFITKYLSDKTNACGSKITVYMSHFNPKSVLSPVANSEDYTFDGPDGIVADLLFKTLNTTATYVTDIAIFSPRFKVWKKLPFNQLSIKYYKYHKEITTSNLISSFNTSNNSSIDFHMTSYMVEPDSIDDELKLETESLYPHDTDCFVIAVPMQLNIESFLQKFIKNGNIESICCVFLFFVVARIIIRRAFCDQWLSIAFETLQLFLVQGRIVNRNAVEASWAILLRGFSLVAITTISAILYKSLIHIQRKEIDTIKELIALNLTVMVPISLKPQLKSFWNTIDSDLQKNIEYVNDEQFGATFGEIYSAYILNEGTASYKLKLSALARKDNFRSRIMKEKLYCRPTSFRIAKTSPFKRATNAFVRKCFENGLYNKIEDWSNNYNNARFQAYQIPPNRGEIVLEMEVVQSAFVWYLVALSMSFSVFVIEILMSVWRRRQRRRLCFTSLGARFKTILMTSSPASCLT